jgi:hypothetical protein
VKDVIIGIGHGGGKSTDVKEREWVGRPAFFGNPHDSILIGSIASANGVVKLMTSLRRTFGKGSLEMRFMGNTSALHIQPD